MISFKQFLLEMPYLFDKHKHEHNGPKYRLKMPDDRQSLHGVADFDGPLKSNKNYHVYLHKGKTQKYVGKTDKSYHLIHAKTGESHMNVYGHHDTNTGMFHIINTVGIKGKEKGAAEGLYRHILNDHKGIVSDTSHTEGSKSLYKKFVHDPTLKVVAHPIHDDTGPGEEVTPDNFESHYTKSDYHKNATTEFHVTKR